MALHLPTVTNYPNGVISVRSLDGTSYNQIITSLGTTIYAVDHLYIKASNNNQITVPIKYQKYDANGNIETFSKRGIVDPYQVQSSLNIDMRKEKLFFDGNLSANVPLLPSETCFIYFYVTQTMASDLLPQENMFSMNDFFENFYESIDYEL